MVVYMVKENSNSLLSLVLLHSFAYLLKQLSEFGIGEAVDELEIRNGASALELMPDAVKNVAFGALNH